MVLVFAGFSSISLKKYYVLVMIHLWNEKFWFCKLFCVFSSTMKAKVPPPLPPKVDKFILYFEFCVCHCSAMWICNVSYTLASFHLGSTKKNYEVAMI
jgi:hypothetical protein